MERMFPQEKHESMRGYFTAELYEAMAQDENIWLLTADLGYKMLDHQMNDFPERAINVGASEQAMLCMAAGLAQENKKVFTYTISSFYLRAAEPIALYIAREQLPVVMLGAGRDGDYNHDGASHHGMYAQEFMKQLGIKSYYPDTKEQMHDLMEELKELDQPAFVSLRR